MRMNGLEVAALVGSLVWSASVIAAMEEQARAPMGDVFSSNGRPNTTATTGTQGVQGNPNCPQPVINGIRPKNWSCKTGTQATTAPAAPQRPWLDQWLFPSAAAQSPPYPITVEQFNSNGQPASPTYPAPTYYGYVPGAPPKQQTRPVQPRPQPVQQKTIWVNQLYGEGYVSWPQTNERLPYKIWLNVDASGAQGVTNVKLEGDDIKRYKAGNPVIVSLKGQRTGGNQFQTTGVWVKPQGVESPRGVYFDASDFVTLRVVRVQVPAP